MNVKMSPRAVAAASFVLVFCALVVSSGCGGAEVPDFTDPSKPIDVKVGKEFTITLDSNETTGYRWQLSDKPDGAVVEKVSDVYKPESTERVGAGGKHVWTFKAVGKGKADISLVYVRPWEKGEKPADEKLFKVTVE